MTNQQIQKLNDSIKVDGVEKTIFKSCEGLFEMGVELCAFLDTDKVDKDDSIVADKMAQLIIILYKLKLIFDNEEQVNECIKTLIDEKVG